MKRIIMFVLLFAALKVAGQTTGYFRFDTVKIMKQNGTCELYVINKTKDSLGLLTNVGGGLTQFRRSKMLNDSTIIIGLDTLLVKGTGGGSGSGTPAGANREIQINNSGAFGAETGVKITTDKTLYADSLNTFRTNIRGDSTFSDKIVFYPSKTKPGSSPAIIGYSEDNNVYDVDSTVNNTFQFKIGPLGGAAGSYIRLGLEKRYMPFPGAGYYWLEAHLPEVRMVNGDVYRPASWTGKETGEDGTWTHRANLHSIYNWNGQKPLGGFSLSTSEMINYHNYSGTGNITLVVKDSTDATGNQIIAGTHILGQLNTGIRTNTTTHYGRDIMVNWESGPFFRTGKSSSNNLGFSYIFSINDTNVNHMFAFGKDFPNRIDFWGHQDGRIVAGNANSFFSTYKFQAHNGENSFISGDYDANNTTVLYSGTFGHALTGGAGAAGMGAGFNFKADNASNTLTAIGDMAGVWSGTPTAGAENGNLLFRTRRAGTMTPSAMSYSTGEFSIETIDSTSAPANMLYQDPNTKKLMKSAAPLTGNAVAHTLDAKFTTAGNSGTGETDLYSYTIPANKLGADGRTVNFEIDGEVNDATATAQIKLWFAGNTTLNTGAINITAGSTAWRLTGYIIRTSSATAHVTYYLKCKGLATEEFLGYSNLTSLDFTTTNIFKITAQAGGAGGGTDDITAHSWQITYKPQPQ